MALWPLIAWAAPTRFLRSLLRRLENDARALLEHLAVI